MAEHVMEASRAFGQMYRMCRGQNPEALDQLAQQHKTAMLEIWGLIDEEPSQKRLKTDDPTARTMEIVQELQAFCASLRTDINDIARSEFERGARAAIEAVIQRIADKPPAEPAEQPAAEPPEQPAAEPPEQPEQPAQPAAEQPAAEQPAQPVPTETVSLDQIELNAPYWVVYYGGTKYKGMWRQVRFTQRPTEGNDHWHIRNSNGRGTITTWITGNIGRVQVEQPSEEELGQRQPA